MATEHPTWTPEQWADPALTLDRDDLPLREIPHVHDQGYTGPDGDPRTCCECGAFTHCCCVCPISS